MKGYYVECLAHSDERFGPFYTYDEARARADANNERKAQMVSEGFRFECGPFGVRMRDDVPQVVGDVPADLAALAELVGRIADLVELPKTARSAKQIAERMRDL